jgi:ABC-type polysaccharide/polyol phosphate export permease
MLDRSLRPLIAVSVMSLPAQYDLAIRDLVRGVLNWRMWGRLGWQETKRRYRRTVIGPFWTTVSLGIFILTLGVLWAQLWKQVPATYLPFLTSGMLSWVLVSTLITEGCSVFTSGENLIKSLRFDYTILTCAVIWRNLLVLLHNFIIFIAVMIYAGVPVTWSSLLVFPGLLLISINAIWVITLLGLLCARFRDVQQVTTSVLQVAMFVTPIFWSPDQLGPRFAKLVDFNILFHFVEIIRAPLLGRPPKPWTYGVVLLCTLVGWSVTIMIYSRFRRRLAYWL